MSPSCLSLPAGQRPPHLPEVLSPIFWRDGRTVVLDQRRLPDHELWTAHDSWEEVARAIRDLEVRGAPAIGCAGAFAVALATRQIDSPVELRRAMRTIA